MLLSRSNQNRLSASAALTRLAHGELTSEALVQSCISRIAHREPSLHAWEYIDTVRALEQARHIDRSGPVGRLAGIPVGVKDIIDTVAMPTTYGSTLFTGHLPSTDAACVQRLHENGAIIVGKTVSTEFAYLSPSRTANPLNAARTPGGSSSGSAAAVADWMVPVALGTQTAGSTIRPASFCGIVGYKPTFDTINTQGIRPLAPSLDTVGLFGRCVDDVALIAASLARDASFTHRLSSDDLQPRYSFVGLSSLRQLYPDTFNVCERVMKIMRSSGIRFDSIDLDRFFCELAQLHQVILAYEAAKSYSELVLTKPGQIGPEIVALVKRGQATAKASYDEARARSEECRKIFDQLLDPRHILLAPAAPGEAPLRATGTGVPVFNSPWTLLHVPCLTVPAMTGPTGLPIGIQLIARRHADGELLAAARDLSEALSRAA